METEYYLLLFPLLSALIALLGFNSLTFRWLTVVLIWGLIPIELYLFRDILNGAVQNVAIFPGLLADRMGVSFALLSAVVVASSLSHACLYFKVEGGDTHKATRWQRSIFFASSSIFLQAMTFSCLSDNLGFLWISIEAATLSSAALVYHARSKNALEACWKYLMICSVGIAFALLGTVLIFASSQHGNPEGGTLVISELMKTSRSLDYPLLRLGFIFCLLGYGTKAGVFPIHSWLPDAYSEAPAPASAMFSGVLNCSLLAIWRIVQIVLASGHPTLALKLPLVLGVVTVLAAGFFLVRQYGIKRLWAYSSIENVGLMLSAIGLSCAPLFFLQALNHSLSKTAVFLISGNVIQMFKSKKLTDIRGLLSRSPVSALLIILAALAVTGAPPFGAFVSEWYILARTMDLELWGAFAALLFAISLSSIAVCVHLGSCLWGNDAGGTSAPAGASEKTLELKGSFLSHFIPACLLISTLLIGISSFSGRLMHFL